MCVFFRGKLPPTSYLLWTPTKKTSVLHRWSSGNRTLASTVSVKPGFPPRSLAHPPVPSTHTLRAKGRVMIETYQDTLHLFVVIGHPIYKIVITYAGNRLWCTRMKHVTPDVTSSNGGRRWHEVWISQSLCRYASGPVSHFSLLHHKLLESIPTSSFLLHSWNIQWGDNPERKKKKRNLLQKKKLFAGSWVMIGCR